MVGGVVEGEFCVTNLGGFGGLAGLNRAVEGDWFNCDGPGGGGGRYAVCGFVGAR
jgi:hypothetical protein